MHKSITALAASALLATVGFATAQSTDPMQDPNAAAPANNPQTTTTTDANGNQTSTTTTVDTTTEVIPAQPTGVVELAKPKNTVMPTDKQPDGPMGMENNLMTTGLVNGITRPSIGDHATPPIPGPDTQVSVTRETTTSTTVTPPVAVTEPAPVAAPAPVEAAPEPVLAPKADRN
jgi:hypothetical protein